MNFRRHFITKPQCNSSSVSLELLLIPQDSAIYMLDTLIALSCLAMINTHCRNLHGLDRRRSAGSAGEATAAILRCFHVIWKLMQGEQLHLQSAISFSESSKDDLQIQHTHDLDVELLEILIHDLQLFQAVHPKVFVDHHVSQWTLSHVGFNTHKRF